jgi:thymidylate kinase/8-oxo-dGTP pyrophosphatase MutT (NUDIX family)
MEDLNNIKIIEYVSIILYRSNLRKIWVSKRKNIIKEFYEHWQCPGGHVEVTDISAKHAAQREVREETGIKVDLKDLKYRRTNHYWRENEWRIVHCYYLQTFKNPRLTEPEEMSEWQLLKPIDVLKEPTIDSLKHAFDRRQTNTKVIMIEGSCGAGKSTFVEKCREYWHKRGKTVEVMDELFITKDPKERIIKYGSNLKDLKENKITKEEMITEAIKLEEWIRDTWMQQIFRFVTRETKPDILLMDRNIFSTEIFMEVMGTEGFLPKENQIEISKNYKYWEWFKRESLVIWWKTPVNEMLKRLEKRGRTGEGDLEYFRKLDETYRKRMLEVYPNVKVITRETLIPKERIHELIPNILSMEEYY